MSQESYLNEKVFNEIFERYYKPCCFCVYNFVKNLEDAEDIVRDSFAKLWIKKGNTPDEQSAKAFVYVASCNAARNSIKHTRVMRERNDFIINFYEKSAGVDDDLINKLVRSEFMSLVYHFIEQLPLEQKKVIKACYIDGLNNREAIVHLNKNIHTLKELKRQGIKHLGKMLNNKETIKNYLL